MYFSLFPKRINYRIDLVKLLLNEAGESQTPSNPSLIEGEGSRLVEFQDFYRHASLANHPFIVDQSFIYKKVKILDGERPEQLSNRLYEDVSYYWTFFIINPQLSWGEALQWPIESAKLSYMLENETSIGQVLSVYNPDQDDDKNLALLPFEIGETVTGQTSNSRGIIKTIRADYGQIFLDAEHSDQSFDDGEEVVGETSGSRVTIDKSNLFPDVIYRYFDDNEGRQWNNTNFIRPDPSQNVVGKINYLTYRQYFELQQEQQSEIRVLSKDSVGPFSDAVRNILRVRDYSVRRSGVGPREGRNPIV